MKIVATSNFALENYSEWLVAENIKNDDFAKVMCQSLNDKFCDEYAQAYYQVKPDEYQLYKFEP